MPRSKDEWVGRNDDAMPPQSVLFRLYDKQGGKCACPDDCGIVMDFDRDEIDCDHTVALQDGGENRETNLQLILRKHHRKKTAAENVARGVERRHKAKAFTGRKKSSFKTNRDGPLKRRMDGTLIDRKTGEIV